MGEAYRERQKGPFFNSQQEPGVKGIGAPKARGSNGKKIWAKWRDQRSENQCDGSLSSWENPSVMLHQIQNMYEYIRLPYLEANE